MPFKVRCPNPECRRSTTVEDELRGRRARCKACGTKFLLVPSEEDAPAPQFVAQPPTASAVESTPMEPLADFHDMPPAPPQEFPAPFSTLFAAPLPDDPSTSTQVDAEVVANRYRLGEVLGKGNFGLVYKAYDLHLERTVAVKLLHTDVVNSPEAVSRFQREAKAAARLHHPHIVPVFDAGRHGDNYFLVAAYIEGEALDRSIPAEGIEPRRAAFWTIQLLEALAAAHRQNVLHRDVKTGNIMVDVEDRVHLMDFGLASWNEGDGARLTQHGAFLGTPAFTAPEQARGDTAAIGPRSDLYSVGVVLYQLLTGHVPFEGQLARVVYQVLQEPAPPPTDHKPDLDPVLVDICMRALAKEPRDRFASCEAMAAELRAWLSDQPTAAYARADLGSGPSLGRPQAAINTPRKQEALKAPRRDAPARRVEPTHGAGEEQEARRTPRRAPRPSGSWRGPAPIEDAEDDEAEETAAEARMRWLRLVVIGAAAVLVLSVVVGLIVMAWWVS